MVTPVLHLKSLTPRQLAALKRKAKQLGVTPDAYVRELIEDDISLDRKAQSASFDELASPFRKALKGATEEDIDHLVEIAHGPRREKSKR